jgi:hypothetical protein
MAGDPWSSEDVANLVQWYTIDNQHVSDISARLGRTLPSVRNKITLMNLRRPPRPEPAPTIQQSQPQLDSVEKARLALEHSRALRAQREELHAVAGEMSLRAMMESLFREIIPTIEPPGPPPQSATKSKSVVQETALFQWSDWHYGEYVSREGTRQLNAYDPAIARSRINGLVSNARGILDRLRSGGYVFDQAVIAANGDFVTGTIHDLERGGPKSIIEHVADCGYLLAESIRTIASDFTHTTVFCTSGNHGRLPDQRRMDQKHPLRNWDTMVYFFAQACLREAADRITFVIPNAYATGFTILGHNFLQQHGHDIKSWNGIPWYGIQRYTSRVGAIEAAAHRHVQYFLFGHFHTATSLPHPGGEMFVNGSLIGATEYGVNALGVSDRPAQWLLGVHEKLGVTHRWPVYP